MPEHNLFQIFVSRLNKLSSDQIDFELLKARIKERTLAKEWQADRQFKIELYMTVFWRIHLSGLLA